MKTGMMKPIVSLFLSALAILAPLNKAVVAGTASTNSLIQQTQPGNTANRVTQVQRNVVIVAGPGGTAFNKEDISKTEKTFQSLGAKTILVGDGERPTSLEDIKAGLEEAKANGVPTTVFVNVHGENKEGAFRLVVGKKSYINAKDFFGSVSETFGKQAVDIFLTSCHGGAALPEIKDSLPKGSQVVVLSQANETTAGSEVGELIDDLMKKPALAHQLSGIDVLNAYLSGLQNRIAPILFVAGQGFFDPNQTLISRIGKKFSEDEKTIINKKLEGIIPLEEQNRVIQTIENGKDENSIYAKDYGLALAVCLPLAKPQELLPVPPIRNELKMIGGRTFKLVPGMMMK